MVNYSKLTKAQLIEQIHALKAELETICRKCESSGLAHELRVHQVELEAQNQELRETQHKLEETRDRYADLYDFSPVGYVTLSKHGVIKGINLTGAAMLGRERAQIVGKPLTLWTTRQSLPILLRHLQHVCHSPEKISDEVIIKNNDGRLLEVSMTSVKDQRHNAKYEICHTVLIDQTERKRNEEKLRRSRELLRELATHHEAVREEERKRVAREIHDELGQALLALKMDIAMLKSSFGNAHPLLPGKVEAMLKLVDGTMESVRSIAANLRPAVLDLGIVPALEWLMEEFQKRTDISCVLEVGEEDIQLDDNVATGIFRIVQESLTNVLRHAHATRVNVSLTREEGKLRVMVKDNGVGIDFKQPNHRKSFGLSGIGERAIMIGGELMIEGKPNEGTTLTVLIPTQVKDTANANPGNLS